MGAGAPLVAVVIGSALFLICVLVVVVSCLSALERGAAAQGAVKAGPLSFHLKVTPPTTCGLADISPEDARDRTREEHRK